MTSYRLHQTWWQAKLLLLQSLESLDLFHDQWNNFDSICCWFFKIYSNLNYMTHCVLYRFHKQRLWLRFVRPAERGKPTVSVCPYVLNSLKMFNFHRDSLEYLPPSSLQFTCNSIRSRRLRTCLIGNSPVNNAGCETKWKRYEWQRG